MAGQWQPRLPGKRSNSNRENTKRSSRSAQLQSAAVHHHLCGGTRDMTDIIRRLRPSTATVPSTIVPGSPSETSETSAGRAEARSVATAGAASKHSVAGGVSHGCLGIAVAPARLETPASRILTWRSVVEEVLGDVEIEGSLIARSDTLLGISGSTLKISLLFEFSTCFFERARL